MVGPGGDFDGDGYADIPMGNWADGNNAGHRLLKSGTRLDRHVELPPPGPVEPSIRPFAS